MVISIPVYWFGLILGHLFAERLHLLPMLGAFDPVTYHQSSIFGKALDRLRHLILPATTLGLAGAAWTARYQRTALRDVLTADHVRTATGKGLPATRVLLVHGLRNALVPTVTLAGLYLPVLFSGAVFVETVFGWYGLGSVAASAVAARDYPVVTGAAMLAATAVVLANLVADLLTAVVDPRART